jgi:branched-chain amino acid transport system substrate-binding protein
MRRPAPIRLLSAALWLATAGACGSETGPDNGTVVVGLLLSYSGPLAANSINSERAASMAIEAANRGGGIAGRSVAIMAGDTRSDPRRVTEPARQLLDGGASIFIGPDTIELAVQLKPLLGDRTLMMPSFTTSDLNIYKPNSWFVMGAPVRRIACELVAQGRTNGHRAPLVVSDGNGYHSLLASELEHVHNILSVSLPSDGASNEQSVEPIVAAPADSYFLLALPPAASSLMYALAARSRLDPSRWYLAPTLHTPALLQTVPNGMLTGAHGVASGTVVGAQDFQTAFAQRWQDTPLDDAYSFYDAGAVAMLALERAYVQGGSIPSDSSLAAHIVAVTNSSGIPVRWNEIERGLALIRERQEIAYVGLSGPLQFDATGQTPGAYTKWWTIGPNGFTDVAGKSDCR